MSNRDKNSIFVAAVCVSQPVSHVSPIVQVSLPKGKFFTRKIPAIKTGDPS